MTIFLVKYTSGKMKLSNGEAAPIWYVFMRIEQRKEQFSIAYVHAIASAAGFEYNTIKVDDDSIDITISSSGNTGLQRRPKFDVQLKCTESNLLKEDHLAFSLDIRAYNNLRVTDLLCPRILIVVVVPSISQDTSEWIFQNEDSLVLKKCGYWVSLKGAPETENRTNKTVHLPRTQIFSVESLKGIMKTINDGGEL